MSLRDLLHEEYESDGRLVLPLLALSLVIWFLVMRLATDTYMGNKR